MEKRSHHDVLNDIKTRLSEIKTIGGIRSPKYKDFARECSKIAESYIEKGNFYVALEIYMMLDDKRGIRTIGEYSLKKELGGYEASNAFMALNDREGIFRAARKLMEEGHQSEANHVLIKYLGDTFRRVTDEFDDWMQKKGLQIHYLLDVVDAINMSHNLADNYDLGIGIARGGLLSAYIFGQFGLDTRVIEIHKDEKCMPVRYVDSISQEDIEGKKVAVFDKDVRTGRTTNRALEAILESNPEEVDLILNYNPINKTRGIGTVLQNVPSGYDNVFYPEKFSYHDFDKAVEILEQKLG